MTTCVFITGTNAVGKTSAAKSLIEHYGGIRHATKWLTYCGDPRVCFAGKYDMERKFGGVDGFNQTKCLEGVVRKGLETCDIIICEGMYLHTFGLNLTNAAFAADRQLLCFLYCPPTVIHERLVARAGKGISSKAVIEKQNNCFVAAKKWASIGVPVLMFDTSQNGVPEITEAITAKIDELCGR